MPRLAVYHGLLLGLGTDNSGVVSASAAGAARQMNEIKFLFAVLSTPNPTSPPGLPVCDSSSSGAEHLEDLPVLSSPVSLWMHSPVLSLEECFSSGVALGNYRTKCVGRALASAWF